MTRRKRKSEQAAGANDAIESRGEPGKSTGAWIVAGAAALLAARPLVTSDGGAALGDGAPFALLWIVLALAWLVSQVSRGPVRLRLSWVDAAVAAFFLWWTVAALYGAPAGALRAAINALWDGVGLFVSYALVRQLASAVVDRRALMAVMIGVGVVLSTVAGYQYFVSMPSDRATFERAPDEAFREAGFDSTPPADSPQYRRFHDRLFSPEPFATFALSNSLAAYVAPWLVVTVAIGMGLARSKSVALRWPLVAAVASGLLLLGCLALARSRAAWIGTAVGLALVLWQAMRRNDGRSMARWRWPISGAAALAIIVATGVAVARPELCERAMRSLSFRGQYWQATAAMIADHPALGVGPGNFQDIYTRYKLPEASEEIGDPHNFAFEIAACAGLPALVIFLVAVWLVVWRKAPNEAASLESAPAERGDNVAPVLVGGAGGVALAIVLYPVLGIPGHALELLLGLAIAAIAIAPLYAWIKRGDLPVRFFMPPIAALLVTLLSSGGIGAAGIAQTLWLLMALGVAATDGEQATKTLSRWAGWLAAVALAVVGLVQYETGYEPVLACKGSMGKVHDAIARNDGPLAVALLRHAAASDPLDAEPPRLLALLALAQWRASGKPAERNSWPINQFAAEADRWLAVESQSSTAWLTVGNGWLEIARAGTQPGASGNAVRCLENAAELYPTSAEIQLTLAEALFADIRYNAAKHAAARAIELDDAMPHEDRKLPPEQRKKAERMANETRKR